MQTRIQSMFETVASTAIGFALSWATWVWIAAPVQYFHQGSASAQGFKITVLFTIISLLRGFGLRRFFNWLHHR